MRGAPETVLLWCDRLACARCGARSPDHPLAGHHVATPEGWLCQRCLARRITTAGDPSPAAATPKACA